MQMRSLRWLAAASLALTVSGGAAEGNPPAIQTRDLIALPGGYGHGSTTLGNWIRQNLERDATGKSEPRGVVVGKGVRAMGELRVGRRVTLVIEGPSAKAQSLRVSVGLQHASGAPDETVHVEQPSGPAGGAPRWLASFTPEKPGEWTYRVSFRESRAPGTGEIETRSGRFTIAPK
jgi:hypothetical protein